ncbi:MAG: SH3 domain-containing protein [Lachnospiraceae bacterium]|nr:SH3 domain-containing protein [Lachnospiraceae bacterium]
MSRTENAKNKKRLFGQGIAALLGGICLILVFVGCWQYTRQQIDQHPQIGEEEGVSDITSLRGTFRTVKSNSLDGVPVYQNPGDSSYISLVPEGKVLQVKAMTHVKGRKWVHINYCGIDGWIPKGKLKKISEGNLYIKKGDTVFMNSITKKGISGYEKPSQDSREIIRNITYGDEFQIDQLVNGWGKTEKDGKICYINMYHMGSYPSDRWKVETLSSAQAVNLRQEPLEDSSLIGKIPENEEITIQEFQHGWGKTTYHEHTGWVMIHYLSPTAPQR